MSLATASDSPVFHVRIVKEDPLVDRLARLEHAQWVKWSQSIAENEDISPDRLARWKTMWVPYDELPDDVKEDDRVWARKVIDVLDQMDVKKSALTNADLFTVIDEADRPELRKYDPDQPRDNTGQWTAAGGSAGSYTEGKVDEHYHANGTNGPQDNVAEKKWAESLSPKQNGALFLYTGGAFRVMNGTLRENSWRNASWPGGPTAEEYNRMPGLDLNLSLDEGVKHLDEAIASAPPLTHDTIAFRYVGEKGANAIFGGGAGTTIKDKGFVSVSLNRGFIEESVLRAPHELMGIEVRIPAGTHAAYPLAAAHGYDTERELILPRDGTYKVLSDNGKWGVVELQPPVAKYDDSQPRDPDGKWASGGGSSTSTTADSVKRDPASFKGKPFWSGAVSTLDGKIEEVHPYDEAAASDFHHNNYFSTGALDRIDNGESAMFFMTGGKVNLIWPARGHADLSAEDEARLRGAIESQIQMRTVKYSEDQPRDEQGRWTEGTASFGGPANAREHSHFVRDGQASDYLGSNAMHRHADGEYAHDHPSVGLGGSGKHDATGFQHDYSRSPFRPHVDLPERNPTEYQHGFRDFGGGSAPHSHRPLNADLAEQALGPTMLHVHPQGDTEHHHPDYKLSVKQVPIPGGGLATSPTRGAPLPLSVKKYDDSQPRDEQGRWTDSGGGADAYGGAQVHGSRALTGSLGIPRSNMPQIRAQHFDEFFQYAAEKGVPFHHATLPASHLRPAQSEYNPAQVAQMPDAAMSKPVVISSDNYVLDGTNRWLKALQTDPHQPVPVIRLEAPAHDALALMHSFPKSERKTVADVGASKPLVEKYDPDQPRDDHGQWTGWGSVGLFYNPSHDEMIASHKNWSRTLTPALQQALRTYKMDGGGAINKALRNGTADRGIETNAKLIDTAITKAPPLSRDTIVYRWLSHPAADGWKKGAVINDKGFVSTSLDEKHVRNYANVFDKVFVEVHVPQGTRAAYMETPQINQGNLLTTEQELLLPRNGSIYVESRNGNRIVVNYAPPGKQVVRKYSPDQPRDETGKWTDAGGGEGLATGMGRSGPYTPYGLGRVKNPRFYHALDSAVGRVVKEGHYRVDKFGNAVPGELGKPWSEATMRREMTRAENVLLTTPTTLQQFEKMTPAERQARLAWRGEMMAKLSKGVGPLPGEPPTVNVVIGGPGAGKSTIIENDINASYKAAGRGTPALLDSDEVKKADTVNYNNGLGANALQDESTKVITGATDQAIRRRVDINLPITGKTFSRASKKEPGLVEQLQRYKAAGYRVKLTLVNATPEFSLYSTQRRFVQEGRFVDPIYVYDGVDSKPEQNYGKLLKDYPHLIDSAVAIDNTNYAHRVYHPELGEK